jgi:DNA polymerase III alpha subunit
VKIDQYGRIELSESETFNALYTGRLSSLDGVNVDSVEQFNSARELNADRISVLEKLTELDISLEDYDQIQQSQWFMPDEYKNMDIEQFLVDQCPKQNYERLVDELVLFRQYNMIAVLKYCKYLVDTMRKHNIIWGVGRGSSVASYVLYLIGIHKIDSIKYNLDIREFLK